jgi:hypothetical protein
VYLEGLYISLHVRCLVDGCVHEGDCVQRLASAVRAPSCIIARVYFVESSTVQSHHHDTTQATTRAVSQPHSLSFIMADGTKYPTLHVERG